MRAELETLKTDIRKRLVASMDMTRDVSDEEILEMIDREVISSCSEMIMTLSEKRMLRSELFHAMRKLDVLQDLVDDPTVTEIMINGKDDIFIEKSGRLSKYDLTFESKEKLEDVIQKIVAGCNRVVNEASPIVDARLENGSRVNIVLPPIALNGPIVTIRRFPDEPINMKKLIGFGSVPEYIVYVSTSSFDINSPFVFFALFVAFAISIVSFTIPYPGIIADNAPLSMESPTVLLSE